jgi:squalene cyclase
MLENQFLNYYISLAKNYSSPKFWPYENENNGKEDQK